MTPPTRLAYSAVLVAGAAVLAACGTTPPPHRPAPTTTSSWSTNPPVTTTAVPVDERTPAQIQVDQAAAAAGYKPSGMARTAHEEMQDYCDTLADPNLPSPPGTWLANAVSGAEQLHAMMRVAFPLLCPQNVALLDAVDAGRAPVEAGSYEIGAAAGKMAPGRWRNVSDVDDCYWERTAADGTILDNRFITHAPAGGVVVTIRASDVSFTSRHCGAWERVG